ncbi:MAG: hypothetical protein ACREMH_04505 [Gemmatimonadales bacterium]
MRGLAAPVLALAIAAAIAPVRAGAQDSIPRPAPDSLVAVRAQPGDSVRPPVSPMGAFWRSLLVPGWGQAKSDRKLAAALFLAWEGVTLGMSIKTNREVHHLEDIESSLVDEKREQREDWMVLLGFNHLMAALEAFVAAHLWDFPGDLRIRRVPGGTQAGVQLPFPR